MSVKTVEAHKSSLGMDANVAILLVYLVGIVLSWIPGIRYFGWLAPLVFFYIENESAFVRFHAIQAFVLCAIATVLGLTVAIISSMMLTTMAFVNPIGGLGVIGFVGTLSLIISFVILIFAIMAMVNGYRYKEYKIPFVGDMGEKLAFKLKGGAGTDS